MTHLLSAERVVDPDLALWTTHAVAGPPYMAPDFPRANAWGRFGAAIDKYGPQPAKGGAR